MVCKLILECSPLTSNGLGSFIHTCVTFCSLAHEFQMEFDVDFSAYPYYEELLEQKKAYLDFDCTISNVCHDNISQVQQILNHIKQKDFLIKVKSCPIENVINCNYFKLHAHEIKQRTKNAVFSFSKKIIKMFQNEQNPIQKPYKLLHIRTGDHFQGQRRLCKYAMEKIIECVSKITNNSPQSQWYVISDNYTVKDVLCKYFSNVRAIQHPSRDIVHFINLNRNTSGISLAFDIIAMIDATEIHSILCISHNSYFTNAVEILYDIPVKQYFAQPERKARKPCSSCREMMRELLDDVDYIRQKDSSDLHGMICFD